MKIVLRPNSLKLRMRHIRTGVIASNSSCMIYRPHIKISHRDNQGITCQIISHTAGVLLWALSITLTYGVSRYNKVLTALCLGFRASPHFGHSSWIGEQTTLVWNKRDLGVWSSRSDIWLVLTTSHTTCRRFEEGPSTILTPLLSSLLALLSCLLLVAGVWHLLIGSFWVLACPMTEVKNGEGERPKRWRHVGWY